jgi:ABC-type phosphate/phosphonate transport system substrate-binding protein
VGLGVLLLAGLGGWQWAKHCQPVPSPVGELQSALDKIENIASFQINSISLTPDELNALTGKYQPQARLRRQFSVGLFCHEEPVQIKMDVPDYAWRLRQIGKAVNDQLRAATVLELKLFRRDTSAADLLSQAKADFMVLDAVSWLEVRARLSGVTPVAREAENSGGVIFTHERTGLRSLRQLVDTRMALPDARLAITALAKARLVEAGIYAGNLRTCTTFTNPDFGKTGGRLIVSQRETIARVQEGKFEAGVTSQSCLKTANPRGLVPLEVFPDSSAIVVARPGLPPATVQAFRKALLSLKQRKPPAGMPRSAMMQYVEINEADFHRLQQALDAAARFDGIR